MQHLAIIPDGNRRWTVRHKYELLRGHHKGREVFKTAVGICLKNKIPYLSIYAFSLENFRRSSLEQGYIFNLLIDDKDSLLEELRKNNIRVRFLGDLSRFPNHIQDVIVMYEKETEQNTALYFNLLFGYGAQYEIVSAAKRIAQQVQGGVLSVDDIDEKSFSNELLTAGMPDPDLIIRTGGTNRLSNFLLYQAAYSEFKFLDCFWPEVTDDILQNCIKEFQSIKRNFGK